MNFKVAILLVLVCVASFGGYLFVNPFLAYDDSYAFMSVICNTGEVVPNLGSDLMWNYVLPYLPCNFFFIKLVLLSLFITSVISISVFGENIVGKEGWRAGLFAATLSPLLFMEATKFENDIFGWALTFVGLALFTLPNWNNNWIINLSARILGIIACFLAVFLYSGSILGVLALVLVCFQVVVIALPLFYVYFSQGFGYLSATTKGIAEELPGVGIVPVALLFVALFDMPKKIKWAGFATFIVGILKAKLMIFALPFLAVGMVELDNKMKATWKHWPNLTIICLIFVPVYFFIGIHTNPDAQDFALIQSGIDLNQTGIPLYNDWSIGWWLTYKGFNTNYKASYPDPDYNNLQHPFIALTLHDNNLNCELIKNSSKINLFNCT